MPTDNAESTSSTTEFAALLDLLGIGDDERVSICSQKPGERLKATVPMSLADSVALAMSTPYVGSLNVFFGVNPIDATGLSPGQRGGDEHVTRCVALPTDIDIKTGGVADVATADTVTKEIAAALGQMPCAVVFSGQGGHTYWALDADDDAWTLDTEAKRADAVVVYRRFHRLCADIAAAHGGSVDNVGQLSRVLRVPGTFNRKDPANPIPVVLHTYPYGGSGPLSFDAVRDALDAYGVPEYDEDREQLGESVSDPHDWAFGDTTRYVATMIDRWRTDTPRAGVNRHNWLVGQSVRLACAHRLGRITDDDHDKAVQVLTERFGELLATHGEPRCPTPGEVAGALAWGEQRAARFTDDRAAEEIGGTETATGTASDDPIAAGLTDAVFGYSEVTRFLRDRAEVRMVSPWALLGAALVQAAAMVPWWVRLPPFVGSDASVNLLEVSAGMTGAGKGASAEVGLDWDAGWDPMGSEVVDDLQPAAPFADLLRERKPGSGQAFAALFMGLVPGVNPVTGRATQELRQTKRVAHIVYPEIDGYAKLAEQQGSTVFDVTRQLFDGKNLGEFTKDRMRVTELAAFAWRAVMTLHAQPEKCGPLLNDDAGGTPQRFLWIHPDWPLPQCDLADEPDAPPPDDLTRTYPIGRLTWPGGPEQVAYIEVDPEIGRILRNIRRQRSAIRSEHATTEQKQGSHRGLLRLKVAVAVAVLHGRCAVTMADWGLAELILEHSDRTVALVRRVLWSEQVRQIEARGNADAIREGSKASAHVNAVRKAAERVLGWLRDQPTGATVTANDLRKHVLGKQERGYAAEVLDALVQDGTLEEAGENRKGSMTYRLAAGL